MTACEGDLSVSEQRRQRSPSRKDSLAMLAAISLGPALLVAMLIAALGATYVWSPNADHRTRAREMILILLGGVASSEDVLAALDVDPLDGSDGATAQSNE
jgi:hypothetical protein